MQALLEGRGHVQKLNAERAHGLPGFGVSQRPDKTHLCLHRQLHIFQTEAHHGDVFASGQGVVECRGHQQTHAVDAQVVALAVKRFGTAALKVHRAQIARCDGHAEKIASLQVIELLGVGDAQRAITLVIDALDQLGLKADEHAFIPPDGEKRRAIFQSAVAAVGGEFIDDQPVLGTVDHQQRRAEFLGAIMRQHGQWLVALDDFVQHMIGLLLGVDLIFLAEQFGGDLFHGEPCQMPSSSTQASAAR